MLTAAEAMLTAPVRHQLTATVGEIRDFFEDDHVHAALILGPAGYLAAVVERHDITRGQDPDAAAHVCRLGLHVRWREHRCSRFA